MQQSSGGWCYPKKLRVKPSFKCLIFKVDFKGKLFHLSLIQLTEERSVHKVRERRI